MANAVPGFGGVMPLSKYDYIALPGVKSAVGLVVKRMKAFGIDDFVSRDLEKPSTYLLGYPGKLLRPTLVFLGAMQIKVRSGRLNALVGLATAIELLHTSSLLHDDMIDNDSVRRGRVAVHVRYGRERALLAGDALISKAIQESCAYGVNVIRSISDSAMDMCAGEMLDYSYQKRRKVPGLNAYLRMAELKSASLIGTSTSIAAVYLSDKNAKRLYAFGKDLGIAFQIRDDVLDFMGLDAAEPESRRHAGHSNAVRAFMKHYGEGAGPSLRRAVALNNSFIERAFKSLGLIGDISVLAGYAKAVRLDAEILKKKELTYL